MSESTIKSFRQATTVTPAGEAEIPEGWGQGRASFGGVIGGLAVRAAEPLAPERTVRSFTLSFVGPLGPGHATAHASVVRSGRALTHVETRIEQTGETRATAQIVFGAGRPGSVHVPPLPMPEVPRAEEIENEMPFLAGVTPDFTQHFAYRWTVEGYPFSGGERAHVQGWIRPRAPESLDAAMVAGLMDAWPPPVWALVDRPMNGSSVNWHVSFTDHIDEPRAHDAWYLYDAKSTHGDSGYSDFEARLWDAEGRLLGCSRQLFADFSSRS